MRGGMRVLVFDNQKVCDAFESLGRVRGTSRRYYLRIFFLFLILRCDAMKYGAFLNC